MTKTIKRSDILLSKFDDSWFAAFGRAVIEKELYKIAGDIKKQKPSASEILPPSGSDKMFVAFEQTPLENVKVVILGQDPYHDGSFNGLAFGNGERDKQATKISPSLRKVISEVTAYYPGKMDTSLYSWAEQGVLLINTAHTVKKGAAGSHLLIWSDFTELVIAALNMQPNVVWMLWGAKAQSYSTVIYNDTHHIINSGHPSPLNRTNPFDGKCFVECNNTLKQMGKEPIKWTNYDS